MSSVYNSWNYTATSSLTKQKEENYLPWSVSSAFTRPTSTNSRKRSFMIDDILKEDSRDIEGRQWILPLLAVRPPWWPFYYRVPSFPTAELHCNPQPIKTQGMTETPNNTTNKTDGVPNYLRTLLDESRKHRRNRTVFSRFQMQKMEEKFAYKKYLSTPDRNDFAKSLCLPSLQLKTWYQNRRMKWKKEMLKIDPTAVTTRSKGRPRKDEF